MSLGVASAREFVGRETKALAAKADVAIVCVGFDPSSEGEDFDRTFRLPAGQDELIRQISSVNKNTIVVITSGGSVDMTQWIDSIPGVIEAWYPGQEGGTALAQILFGEYSPSGKLPVSFERQWEDNATFASYYPKKGTKQVEYSEGLFLGYRHFDRGGPKPLFPFGYGLSYTTFAYQNLKVSPETGNLNQSVTVSFDLENTGHYASAEVAEVYVRNGHSLAPRPIKELKGFARIELKPGESRQVSVALDRRAFSYYDLRKKDWSADPGSFGILVGSASDQD